MNPYRWTRPRPPLVLCSSDELTGGGKMPDWRPAAHNRGWVRARRTADSLSYAPKRGIGRWAPVLCYLGRGGAPVVAKPRRECTSG
jgi:hypothetical protein